MNENFLPEAHLCGLMPFIPQQHRFLFSSITSMSEWLSGSKDLKLLTSQMKQKIISEAGPGGMDLWLVILATCELKAGGQEKRSYKEMGRKARRSGALWIGDVEGCCNLSNTSSIAWMDPSLLCSPDESNRPEESPACTAFHTLWSFQY